MAITHIEAEKLLNQSRVALLPNSKKSYLKRWFDSLERLKFKSKNRGRRMTLDDLAVKISKGG